MKIKLTNFYGNPEAEHLVNTIIRSSPFNFINTGFYQNDIIPVLEAIRWNETYLLNPGAWDYSMKEKQKISELIQKTDLEKLAKELHALCIPEVYFSEENRNNLFRYLDELNLPLDDIKNFDLVVDKMQNWFLNNSIQEVNNKQYNLLFKDYLETTLKSYSKNYNPVLSKYVYLVLLMGPGFHPDNELDDYVDVNGKDLFPINSRKWIKYNTVLNDAFEYFTKNESDIYEFTMNLLDNPETFQNPLKDRQMLLFNLEDKTNTELAEIWANELSNPTLLSKGMSTTEIDEREAEYSRLAREEKLNFVVDVKDKKLYHTSNPFYRKKILEYGKLIPKQETWGRKNNSDFNNHLPDAIFCCLNKPYDSGYDDDIYEINTKTCPNIFYNDSEINDNLSVYTLESIDFKYLKLIKEGNGNSND